MMSQNTTKKRGQGGGLARRCCRPLVVLACAAQVVKGQVLPGDFTDVHS